MLKLTYRWPRVNFNEWGRYLGIESVIVEHPFRLTEYRENVLFENHWTLIRKFRFNNVNVGTYDSRYNTMYLIDLLRRNTTDPDNQYDPINTYLNSLIRGASIEYHEGLAGFGVLPRGLKKMEDMCGPYCPYHPLYPMTAPSIDMGDPPMPGILIINAKDPQIDFHPDDGTYSIPLIYAQFPEILVQIKGGTHSIGPERARFPLIQVHPLGGTINTD